MNSAQLHEWMKYPGSLGKDASAELDDVVQRFPYFQTAQLLYIKSLHNENSFLYNNQLKTAAAYAVNRKVLYDLITNKNEKLEVGKGKLEQGTSNIEYRISNIEQGERKKEETKTVQPDFPKKRFTKDPDEWESGMIRQLQLLHHWNTSPAEILQQRIRELEAEKSKSEEKNPSTLQPIDQLRTQDSEFSETKTDEKKPSATDEINTLLYVLVEPTDPEDVKLEESAEETNWEVKTVGNDVNDASKVEVPEDSVQQEIMVEAITSSIELEVDDKLPTLEELTGKPSEKQEFKLPKFEERKPGVVKEVEQEDTSTGLSLTTAGTALSPEIGSTEETSFGGWLNSLHTQKEIQAQTGDSSQEKLIEKFIQEQPRIQPSKTTFYNPINMARKSVQDSDEFLTETLARIYAKQGNIPKAIRAYQKLSLKFPEKTAYFAALIEELKRTPTK